MSITKTNPHEKAAPQTNGLARWREAQRVDRDRRLAELESLRQDAITIVRGEREFKVVTIPDKYTW